MPEHVRVAYEDAIQQLLFIKKQQWIITNYAIAIYVAFASLKFAANDLTLAVKVVSSIVIWSAFMYNVCFLLMITCDIESYRGILRWIRKKYFSEEEADGLGFNIRKHWFFSPGVLVALAGTSLVGAAMTTAIVWAIGTG